MDLKFYLSLFLRRLPLFVIIAALGATLGLTFASVLPPVYVAQARLLLEGQQIPDSLAASTVRTAPTEQLQIIQQRIQTRAELLELASRLEIYAPAPGRPAPQMSPDAIVDDMRSRIRIGTGSGAAPARGAAPQATIVTVSFEAPTAAMSALVANELVTMILDQNVSMRTGVAGQTLDFFEQEVARLDKELAVRSATILEFQQENAKALPDSLDFRRSQQAAAQERLLQLTRDETALKNRRDTLVTLYEQTGEVASPTENLTPDEQKLKTLRDQLTQALAIYSEQNPRVKLLQQQVGAMEKVVAAQKSAPSTGAAAGAAPPSAYEVQLADIDSQLELITEQKAEINARLADLAQSIAATPGNAISLDTLQRDYAAVRAQYDLAVQNRARAETGDLIETLSKGQRISIIEQAVVPRQPVRPNRVLIAAAGIGGGIVAGLGLILLLELLNRSIRRPVELTRKLGITPFATLPYVRTQGEARFRRIAISLALLAVLGGIPAGLWAINTYYMPLDLVIERGINKLGLTEIAAQTRESLGQ